MNATSPISLPLYDFNIDSSTNVFEGYSSSMSLLSLPARGTLYSSSMEAISSLPPSGLPIVNSTFFFEPIPGEFASEPYATLVFSLQNSYGTLRPKTVSIFVDWVNHVPIVHDRNYTLSTSEVKTVAIDVVDYDGDKNYTRFVQISPNCRVLTPMENGVLFGFAFAIEYEMSSVEGAEEDVCTVELVVGDSHGGESSPATLRFHVTNLLSLNRTVFEVREGVSSLLDLEFDEEVVVELTRFPTHGELWGNSTLLTYVAEPLYFTSPKIDADGDPIGHEDEGFACRVIHKGLASPSLEAVLVIQNVNSPARY